MCELSSNDVTAQCAKWEAATGSKQSQSGESEAQSALLLGFDYAGGIQRKAERWEGPPQQPQTQTLFQLSSDATPLVPGWWKQPLRRTSHLSRRIVLHAFDFSRHGPAVVCWISTLLRQCAVSQSHCGIVPAAFPKTGTGMWVDSR
jgi:hypothetical protein